MSPGNVDFAIRVVRDYTKSKKLRPAEDVVHMTKVYFKQNYDEHIKKGRGRKTCFLSTTQNTLSRIKKEFCELGVEAAYLKDLKLSQEDMDKLNKSKAAKLHDEGVEICAVPADSMILDCRDILTNPRASRGLKTVAMACLTGRRMVEILLTASFGPPTKKHNTHEQYWANVEGLVKQRGKNIAVEIPLLEQRTEINKSLREIRNLYPCPPSDLSPDKQKQWISRKYSKEIARVMHRFCPMVQKIHNFRKFYAASCNKYFAENDASEARLASDYLGHRQLSSTVLTYMNFRVEDIGSLDFVSI